MDSPNDPGPSSRMAAPGPTTGPEPDRRRIRVLVLVLAALAGATVSALPHALWWARLGQPYYVPDRDDLYYLSLSAQAYFEDPTTLSDPVFRSGGLNYCPSLLFIPCQVAARALELGPLGVGLIWRLVAGLTTGAALALLLQSLTRSGLITTLMTVVFLADIGVLAGKPLVVQAAWARHLFDGWNTLTNNKFQPYLAHWRVPFPGMILGFLFLHVWTVLCARERPTPWRIVLAGVGYGLLFHVYFYYWTAATLALALAVLADREARWTLFRIGLIGGLVGLPAVWASWRVKHLASPDWLPRVNKFLPIPRTSELLLPLGAWLMLAAALIWIWQRHRELRHLALLTLAALLLVDHQLVTGLDIQNYHWVFVWGPTLYVLVLGVFAGPLDRFVGQSYGRCLLCVLLVLGFFAVGLTYRAKHALLGQQTVGIMTDYSHYRDQRLSRSAVPLEPNQVVAGEADFVAMAAILEDQRPLSDYAVLLSPTISNTQWERRLALDAWLRGQTRPEFISVQRAWLRRNPWGPWSLTRSRARMEQRLAAQIAAFDTVAASPGTAIADLGVRYLALPPGSGPPSTTSGAWSLRQDGPTWSVWEYQPPDPTDRSPKPKEPSDLASP